MSVCIEEGDNYTAVTTVFTSSSTARGAMVLLNNTDDQGSCESGIQVLIVEKMGTRTTANYTTLPKGNYSASVVALESNGTLTNGTFYESRFEHPSPVQWNLKSTNEGNRRNSSNFK